MNKQDEKLLKLYLKDIRRKKIFCLIIVAIFISIIFYSFYCKYKQDSNYEDNLIQNESIANIIIENNTNKENTVSVENSIVNNNIQIQDKVEEIEKEKTNTVINKENTEQKVQVNTNATLSNENKKTKEKPANKDFLFTDGYTMDNVTQNAQDYLKSYNFSGECVPIKDNDGVFLGMRVIFY